MNWIESNRIESLNKSNESHESNESNESKSNRIKSNSIQVQIPIQIQIILRIKSNDMTVGRRLRRTDYDRPLDLWHVNLWDKQTIHTNIVYTYRTWKVPNIFHWIMIGSDRIGIRFWVDLLHDQMNHVCPSDWLFQCQTLDLSKWRFEFKVGFTCELQRDS